MIPRKVLNHIKYNPNFMAIAELNKDNISYTLSVIDVYDNGCIYDYDTTKRIDCNNNNELIALSKKGYTVYKATSLHPAFAEKEIGINELPKSKASEWELYFEN